jgi:hypothetical protein
MYSACFMLRTCEVPVIKIESNPDVLSEGGDILGFDCIM